MILHHQEKMKNAWEALHVARRACMYTGLFFLMIEDSPQEAAMAVAHANSRRRSWVANSR
jgi:hypothetical protein